MRPEVAAKLSLACQSAACAPPPVGTGGSSRGASTARKRKVRSGVAKKLRKAMKSLDPAIIKATPADPSNMGWSRDTHRGLSRKKWPATAS